MTVAIMSLVMFSQTSRSNASVKDQLCHKISRKITCPNVVLREINANVRVEFSMAVRLIVKFKKSIRNTKVTIIKVKKNIPSTALLNSLGL